MENYNQNKNNDCAVIISSFDGYSDVWEPFFILFFKYWPDCPFPIHLITNKLKYPDKRIISTKLGNDEGWSTNLIKTLKQINSEYVIYLQEDYFLNDKVNNERIFECLDTIRKENAVYLRLRPNKNSIPYKNYSDINLLPKDIPYLNSTQAAIWNKEELLKILKEGETGWDFEIKGGIERARKLEKNFLCANKKIIPYFATAIVKGKFLPGAIKLCKKEGIKIKSKRKTENHLRLWLRKNKLIVRIYLKIKKYAKRNNSLS